MSKPRDIHQAVDALIQRQRIRLQRDDTGRTEWQTIPSLFEQLESSIGYSGTGTGSGGGFGSQAPASVSVVSLIIEISATTAEATTDLAGKSLGNVPDNLRRLASVLTGDPELGDQLAWWTDRVIEWRGRARVALRLNPQRPSWARGIRCPDCGADQARAELDGERVQTPALAITWGGPDDDRYHGDHDWMVRAVECRSCGACWMRGSDLDQLVADMLRNNLTRETGADVA